MTLKRAVIIDGVLYESVAAAALAHDLPHGRVKARIQSKYFVEWKYETTDEEYKRIKEARTAELEEQRLRKEAKKKQVEEAVEQYKAYLAKQALDPIAYLPRHIGNKSPVIIEGVRYESIRVAAEVRGMTTSGLQNKIIGGKHPEWTYEASLPEYEQMKAHKKNKQDQKRIAAQKQRALKAGQALISKEEKEELFKELLKDGDQDYILEYERSETPNEGGFYEYHLIDMMLKEEL